MRIGTWMTSAFLIVAVLAGCSRGGEGEGEGRPAFKLSRDHKYWRGEYEASPGPFLCAEPAATDVWVTCDRWPDTSDLRQFGLDAYRLSGAKTNHEKCLAVFRWLRRCVINGNAPYEPFAEDKCWDDYFKWLNVYGGHYCSGVSRSMEMYWRAMGYRGSKVYTGHTVVDVHFTDYDGVARWHHFDANRGRYMLDRSARRLLGTDDLTIDSVFTRTVAVHRYQGGWSKHRMGLALRPGEKLLRIWGNWGKIYQSVADEDVKIKGLDLSWWCEKSELGPYSVKPGNGRWTYSPDLADPAWQKGLAAPPANMAKGKLQPAAAGAPATAVWHFRTPYIVSDAKVELSFARKSADDTIRLHLSVDGGKTWKPVWECPADKVGDQKLIAKICKKFDVNAAKANARKKPIPQDFNSPFGRYAFRLKLELVAKRNPADCQVKSIAFQTDVQQNKFALPQLWPGKNKITVRGKLAKGAALKVTYVWDDPQGKGRKNVTIVEKAPYTYEIIAAGKQWKDCVCKELIVETIPATGKGNRTEVKEKPSKIHKLPPMSPPGDSCGSWSLGKRDRPIKLPPLEAVLAKLNVDTDYKELRNTVLAQLIEHGNPKAYDATKKFFFEYVKSGKRPKGVKGNTIVALYVMDPKRTKIRPFLLEVIKDPKLWERCDAIIAIMAKVNGWKEFVPPLVKVMNSGKGASIAILNTFSVIGDESTAGVVKKYLNVDHTGQQSLAALAAGRTGDRSLIPRLREMMRRKVRIIENYRPAKINAVLALGMLKDLKSAPEIREYLKYVHQEAWRAKAAESLGYMGDKKSIPALKAALAVEPLPWVREVMKASLDKLRAE